MCVFYITLIFLQLTFMAFLGYYSLNGSSFCVHIKYLHSDLFALDTICTTSTITLLQEGKILFRRALIKHCASGLCIIIIKPNKKVWLCQSGSLFCIFCMWRNHYLIFVILHGLSFLLFYWLVWVRYLGRWKDVHVLYAYT